MVKRCKTQVLKRCKTEIHDLPKEILSDILSRLPAESLNSNKVVSKFWYNLISDTKFVDAHLSRTCHQWEYQQAIVLKLSEVEGEVRLKKEYQLMNFTQSKCEFSKFEFEYELSDLEQERTLSFRSSCDGILLFSHVNYRKELYVFNPVTRKYRVLPILETYDIADCALIYDDSVRKYKVVAISGDMQRCYLYTLDNSYHSNNKRKTEQITSDVVHWRDLITPYEESSILSLPTVVNNKLHWLATIDDFEEFIIMSTMDVLKEEFKETKIPFLTPGDWGKNTIVEFMGSLGVIDYPENLKQLDIWTTLQGEWTKTISIPYEFELRLRSHYLGTSIFQNRILVSHKKKIFIYDLENKDWKTINIPGQEDSYYSSWIVHANSLVKWG